MTVHHKASPEPSSKRSPTPPTALFCASESLTWSGLAVLPAYIIVSAGVRQRAWSLPLGAVFVRELVFLRVLVGTLGHSIPGAGRASHRCRVREVPRNPSERHSKKSFDEMPRRTTAYDQRTSCVRPAYVHEVMSGTEKMAGTSRSKLRPPTLVLVSWPLRPSTSGALPASLNMSRVQTSSTTKSDT